MNLQVSDDTNLQVNTDKREIYENAIASRTETYNMKQERDCLKIFTNFSIFKHETK